MGSLGIESIYRSKGIVHLYNLGAYEFAWSCIHYRERIWNIWKVPWKHTYLIFCFAGNGLPPTTNKYCDFNSTLTLLIPDTASNIFRPEHFTWGLYKSHKTCLWLGRSNGQQIKMSTASASTAVSSYSTSLPVVYKICLYTAYFSTAAAYCHVGIFVHFTISNAYDRCLLKKLL